MRALSRCSSICWRRHRVSIAWRICGLHTSSFVNWDIKLAEYADIILLGYLRASKAERPWCSPAFNERFGRNPFQLLDLRTGRVQTKLRSKIPGFSAKMRSQSRFPKLFGSNRDGGAGSLQLPGGLLINCSKRALSGIKSALRDAEVCLRLGEAGSWATSVWVTSPTGKGHRFG